tara:strand:- start:167 stop:346 length:180 start_codon:yes stop_codon:yes gene_type:complete
MPRKKVLNMFDVRGGLDPQTNLDRFKITKKSKRKYLEKVLRRNQRMKNTPTNQQERRRK